MAACSSLSIIAILLHFIGLFHNLTRNNKNDCEMTYMFEYPQFVRIHVPENQMYNQYRLFAYSEGRFTESARKMRFDGIPVLFLPGNAGSYKQVRSLASVALRKSVSSIDYITHFDYFTVDYNDELSGLFGGVLMKQTEFARYCIKSILKLYGGITGNIERLPKSVIVIGHSMGGLIAKGILNNNTFNNINLIITLAAPLEGPVLNLDYYIHNYYTKVDHFWKSSNSNRNKTLISLGGGPNDLLMPSSYISSPDADLQALTTSIPGVWVSTDHRSILWCRQLVLVLNKFLFSIIDHKTRQVTLDQNKIIQEADYFIKDRKRSNISTSSNAVKMLIDKQWYEDNRRQYTVRFAGGIMDTSYYMIRLINLSNHQYLTVVMSDMDNDNWIFGCNASYIHGTSRVCYSATPLKQFISWLATARSHGKRQIASLNLHSISLQNPTWTHIIVKLSPLRKTLQFHVDVYNKNCRTVMVSPSFIYNNIKQTIVLATEPDALHYEIVFSGFDRLYQAYFLYVEPVIQSCSGSKYLVTAEMKVSWFEGHDSNHHFTETDKSPMKLILMKEKPFGIEGNVTLSLLLDPNCKYKISYSDSVYENLGQFSRHYTTSLIPIVALIVLLTARKTMTSVAEVKEHSTTLPYFKALWSLSLEPYYLIVASKLILSIKELATMNAFSISSIIGAGYTLVVNEPNSIFILPLFQFLVALGAVHILTAIGQLSLLLSGQIAHKMLIRMVWRGPGARGIAGVIRRVPGFAAAILTAIAPSSCGVVALAAGGVFYFFMLTRMYEDFLEAYFYKMLAAFAKKIFKRSESSESNLNKDNHEEILQHGQLVSQRMISNTEKPSEAISKLQSEDLKNNTSKTIENNTLQAEDKILQIKDVSQEVPNIETFVLDVHEGTLDISNIVEDVHKAVPDIQSVVPDVQTATTVSGSNAKIIKGSSIQPQKSSSPSEVDEDADAMSGLHFHFMMFTLWCVVTAMNIPSLITWAHNFKYNMALQSDPSFIPGLIMVTSGGFLWQIDRPKKNLSHWRQLNTLLYGAACLILLFGPTMLFTLNYILSTSFALITAHQLFTKELEPEAASSAGTGEDSTIPSAETNVSNDSTPLGDFADIKEKLETTDIEL